MFLVVLPNTKLVTPEVSIVPALAVLTVSEATVVLPGPKAPLPKVSVPEVCHTPLASTLTVVLETLPAVPGPIIEPKLTSPIMVPASVNDTLPRVALPVIGDMIRAVSDGVVAWPTRSPSTVAPGPTTTVVVVLANRLSNWMVGKETLATAAPR